MIPLVQSSIAIVLSLTTFARAQYDTQLVGTWTTKSKSVVTGPGFYNPVADKFIEPAHTGISYSFTADGWYEEAYYRAISNPQQPQCPSAIMQWQHGRYSLPGNGSIVFEPIAVDGRQQTSSPCSYDTSLYIRYNQPELMSKYAVYIDPYHNVQRLDLYEFDGSPMHPMFLQYSPPQMLPTQTLNPTVAAATGAVATASSRLKKRGNGGHFDGDQYHLQAHDKQNSLNSNDVAFDNDKIWWVGVGLIGIGTVMYMLPTSRQNLAATR